MKKHQNTLSLFLAETSLKFTKANVNSACWFYAHQPKLPENSDKLRLK